MIIVVYFLITFIGLNIEFITLYIINCYTPDLEIKLTSENQKVFLFFKLPMCKINFLIPNQKRIKRISEQPEHRVDSNNQCKAHQNPCPASKYYDANTSSCIIVLHIITGVVFFFTVRPV